MSELLLPVALFGVFAAVLLFVSVTSLQVAQRRRSVQLLQAQVKPLETNVRERELARPLSERLFATLVKRIGEIAKSLTPEGARQRTERKLVLAGSPTGWDLQRFLAVKAIGLLLAAGLTVLMVVAGSASVTTLALVGLLATLLGFFGPDAVLSSYTRERQEKIRRAVPDTLDLLTIMVEAGLGFDAALSQVMTNVPGPLSQEIGRTLQEIRLGVPRTIALRNLAARTDVDDLSSFVLAVVQADSFGVSVVSVMRAQSTDMRRKRRQRAERRGMQIPVKILFPTIFCVMPSIFVVILGPAVIKIIQGFFGSGGL